MLTLIPAITFLALLLINTWVKRSFYVATNMIFGIYFFSFCCSVYLELFGFYSSPRLQHVLVLTVTLIVYTSPFILVPEHLIVRIRVLDAQLYRIGVWFTAGLAFISFLYFLPSIVKVLNASDLGQERLLVNAKVAGFHAVSSFTALITYLAQLYVVCIFFFILEVLRRGRVTFLSCFLLLGSLSIVLYVAGNFGRDGVVRWSLPVFFSIIMVNRFLRPTARHLLKVAGASFSGVLVVFASALTVSRFQGRAHEIWIYVIDYIGQTPFNYSNSVTVMAVERPYWGEYMFPLFFNFFNRTRAYYMETIIDMNVAEAHVGIGEKSNVFGTFLKSFLVDFGVRGSLVVGFLVAFCVALVSWEIWKTRELRPSSMLFLMLYATFLMQGVFFNIWSGVVANVMMMSCAVVWGYCRFTEMRSPQCVERRM